MKINFFNNTGYGNDTVITTENGEALRSVSHATIDMGYEGAVKATLTFILPNLNIDAEATVSEQHLHELAKAHGFKLIKDEK